MGRGAMKARRVLTRGVCYQHITYSPLPSQQRFHQSEARFKGFSGPIGSGKSQALCQEAIKLSYINAGRLGLLGAPTYPMLRDATMSALLEILDRNAIPFEHNKGENTLVMKDTGSRILFRPVEEFERLRGTNLAWFGLDELTYTQEESWLRLEGRLRDPRAQRLCGFGVWTPKGYDWVYRRFFKQKVAGYDAITAAAYENRHLLDKVPDFYERLKDSYDEVFYRQEVLGEYLNANGGRVYHAFDRAKNVCEVTPRPDARLLWALDFNVNPMCSVVVQLVGDTVLVLDEIVLERASTWQACAEFQNRYRDLNREIVIYGDASGNAMQTAGVSDYQMIQQYFDKSGYTRIKYKVAKANPAVRDRIALVNGKLKNAAGVSDLLVSPKCKELIKDFEEVSYKAGSALPDKDSDKGRTHLSDALGYLLWSEFHSEVAGERNRRLPCQ